MNRLASSLPQTNQFLSSPSPRHLAIFRLESECLPPLAAPLPQPQQALWIFNEFSIYLRASRANVSSAFHTDTWLSSALFSPIFFILQNSWTLPPSPSQDAVMQHMTWLQTTQRETEREREKSQQMLWQNTQRKAHCAKFCVDYACFMIMYTLTWIWLSYIQLNGNF